MRLRAARKEGERYLKEKIVIYPHTIIIACCAQIKKGAFGDLLMTDET